MKDFKIGLQLYTVRKEMEADMDATLGAVKKAGYDYVELAGFFDKSAEEIKALLDKHGLVAISVHRGIRYFLENGQAEVDYIKTLGAKYCGTSGSYSEFFENWDGAIDNLKKVGKLLAENGIRFLYHNHDFEFSKIDGQTILDRIYAQTPREAIGPEFDTCWIYYGGNDPAEYLRERADIGIEVVHIKDFSCKDINKEPIYSRISGKVASELVKQEKEENEFKFRPIGEGIQDFASILDACESVGAEYIIVEQDSCYGENPLDCVARSRAYLKDHFNI